MRIQCFQIIVKNRHSIDTINEFYSTQIDSDDLVIGRISWNSWTKKGAMNMQSQQLERENVKAEW